jgi:copper chaperone CopZ
MKTLACMMIVVGLLVGGGCSREGESATPTGPQETRVYAVTGMTCQGCVKSITEALSELEGVSMTEISLEAKQLTIHCTPQLSDATVVAAIEGRGYQAKRTESPAP